jgi:hypothetical protein
MDYDTTEGRPQGATAALKGQAEQVSEKAREVKGTVQDRVREQVDSRSTQAGEQVGSVSEAMRSMGEQLRGEGNDLPAQLAQQAAEKTEQLGRYLREADADQILKDVEDFGRRQPWVVAAAGLALGVAAARFVKASSRRRYQSDGYESRQLPSPRNQGSTAYGSPAAVTGGTGTAYGTAGSYASEPVGVTPPLTEQERGTYPARGSE